MHGCFAIWSDHGLPTLHALLQQLARLPAAAEGEEPVEAR